MRKLSEKSTLVFSESDASSSESNILLFKRAFR